MNSVKNIKKKYSIENFKEIDNYINNIHSFENYSFNTKTDYLLKNQLFSKEYPPFDLVKKILYIILNKDITDDIYFEFNINIMIIKNIIEKINIFIPELKKYYLKCKHQKYLENLNEKKIITIFRQILKPYNFYIKAIEKYENGKKYLLYIIQKNKNIHFIEKDNFIINFD